MVKLNYKGINLIAKHRHGKARMVQIVNTNKALRTTTQSVWIPNKHFDDVGNLLPNQDIDYVFRKRTQCLVYAGYHSFIHKIISQQTINDIIGKEQQANYPKGEN